MSTTDEEYKRRLKLLVDQIKGAANWSRSVGLGNIMYDVMFELNKEVCTKCFDKKTGPICRCDPRWDE